MKAALLSLTMFYAAALVHPAHAEQRVLDYRVQHPLYGDIGTYTTVIEQSDADVEVRSTLQIRVKLFGLLVHQQNATSTEHWHEGRLVGFRSESDANGEVTRVSGAADSDRFVIEATAGRFIAPGDVRPSNPWSPEILAARVVMSTRTGKLFNVRLGATAERIVTVDGKRAPIHEFEVIGEKRQALWLDDSGAPAAFRTEENGTTIGFVRDTYASSKLKDYLWPPPADTLDIARSSR